MIKLSPLQVITGRYHEQSAILPMSVNLAVLLKNCNSRKNTSIGGILTILRTNGNQALKILKFLSIFKKGVGYEHIILEKDEGFSYIANPN